MAKQERVESVKGEDEGEEAQEHMSMVETCLHTDTIFHSQHSEHREANVVPANFMFSLPLLLFLKRLNKHFVILSFFYYFFLHHLFSRRLA